MPTRGRRAVGGLAAGDVEPDGEPLVPAEDVEVTVALDVDQAEVGELARVEDLRRGEHAGAVPGVEPVRAAGRDHVQVSVAVDVVERDAARRRSDRIQARGGPQLPRTIVPQVGVALERRHHEILIAVPIHVAEGRVRRGQRGGDRCRLLGERPGAFVLVEPQRRAAEQEVEVAVAVRVEQAGVQCRRVWTDREDGRLGEGARAVIQAHHAAGMHENAG